MIESNQLGLPHLWQGESNLTINKPTQTDKEYL
jgi:hypothetical protein